MASINYIDNANNNHSFELKEHALDSILNEFGCVENYLIYLGVHYIDCDYEY